MKPEDLKVAAENAAQKAQTFNGLIERFALYSEEFMLSDEYKNLRAIVQVVTVPDMLHGIVSNNQTHRLVFDHRREGTEVPFYSLNQGEYKALTWEDVARYWFAWVTGGQRLDESTPELFWDKIVEHVDNSAHRFRLEHDTEYRQSVIARRNEEKEVAEKAEGKKLRQWLYKVLGTIALFILAFIIAVIYFTQKHIIPSVSS